MTLSACLYPTAEAIASLSSQYPLLWMRCNKVQWLKNSSASGAIALSGSLYFFG
ncbi:hypothetical protein [Nostoc sp.]|uniref:hypothetical protein n=1 Tax=Nostoc sp. TaxID=1180 RepID=UPI002FF6E13C